MLKVKILFILGLLLIGSTLVFGGEKNTKWGVNLYPGVSVNQGSLLGTFPSNPGFCLSANGYIQRNLSDKSKITYGVGILTNGYQVRKFELIFSVPDTTAPTYLSLKGRDIFLEIPINYRFSVNDKFFITTGISLAPLIFLTRNSKYYYADGTVGNSFIFDNTLSYGFLPLFIYLNAGIGYVIYEDDSKKFYLQPSAQIETVGLFNGYFGGNYFNFGINIGLLTK